MKIAVLPGDGIGPEIMAEALKVLDYIVDDESLDVEIESGTAWCSGLLRVWRSIPRPHQINLR